MGNECTSNPKYRDDLQIIRQYEDKALGFIRVIHSESSNTEVAIKEFIFNTNQQMQKYIKVADLAKQYNNIATLVKLNSYSIQKRINCSPYTVVINFNYVNKHLSDVLEEKRYHLREFQQKQKKIGSNSVDILKLSKIKLFQYEKIDKMTFNERKYLNCYFQEGQILRMIDHVIGAIYFLNHFQSHHNSLRPENILVDDDNKYILIDRNIFRLKTNYELFVKDKIHNNYLSPQQMSSARTKDSQPKHHPQLTDIFSVGLIALEMASMESLDNLYDFNTFKLNSMELIRLVNKSKSRYSEKFMELIQLMLTVDQDERVNFEQVIDILTPVLNMNLEAMQRVYKSVDPLQQMSFRLDQEQETTTKTLQSKLIQIQESYHKIMSNRMLNDFSSTNEDSLVKDEQRILLKLKTLKTVSSFDINIESMKDRQIGGSELYDLYMKQYQSIKQSRQK